MVCVRRRIITEEALNHYSIKTVPGIQYVPMNIRLVQGSLSDPSQRTESRINIITIKSNELLESMRWPQDKRMNMMYVVTLASTKTTRSASPSIISTMLGTNYFRQVIPHIRTTTTVTGSRKAVHRPAIVTMSGTV